MVGQGANFLAEFPQVALDYSLQQLLAISVCCSLYHFACGVAVLLPDFVVRVDYNFKQL